MAKSTNGDAEEHVSHEWLARVLDVLASTHKNFSQRVPAPQKYKYGDGYRFGFVEKTLEQAMVLKLARIVTGLRAAALLIENGYLQEAATGLPRQKWRAFLID